MENIIAGLIRGRHDLPVEQYIFEGKLWDVHDYGSIRAHVEDWIAENVGIVRKDFCIALNQADDCDTPCFVGEKSLTVYVTGLTPVTAEVIRCCAINGVKLTLMHYNTSTGEYEKQYIF